MSDAQSLTPSHAAPISPEDVQATFCATIVDEWVRSGVRHAVVSPGSRSTPLAIALLADDRLAVHVHHDERAAAFVALGIGKASGVPAVVLTTSGTAAVELHPAVVEADHDRVPLLACTADRPPELRDVGAPQTVDQAGLYGRSVRWQVDPGVADLAAAHTWRSVAARSVAAAMGATSVTGPGPVHLNLPFREPLVGTPTVLPPARTGSPGRPWHTVAAVHRFVDDTDAVRLVELLRGRRGVIVAGDGIDDPGGVLLLARRLAWPVLADPRSGCRVADEVVVAHADAIARCAPTGLVPDVVVRFGSWPASKLLPRWLTGCGAVQVLVEGAGRWTDPEGVVERRIEAPASAVLAAVVPALEGAAAPIEWMRSWRAADDTAEEVIHRQVASSDQLTEPAIARDVVATLSDGTALVVSSSMPVRDVEWFAAPRSGVGVLANRGANGIDGVVSTAVGVALTGIPTAVLVGDVAMLHDTNALLGLAERDVDLTIVVVDNRGGGIFSFLPQATSLPAGDFEMLFGTPHDVDIAQLAAVHGVPARTVRGRADLVAAVEDADHAGGVHVVVARTERVDNVEVHRRIHDQVAQALA